MFDIGDLVVCVDDSPGRGTGIPSYLKNGMLYIVEKAKFFDKEGEWGVRVNNHDPHPGHYLMADRFRKVPKVKDKVRELEAQHG